MRPLDPLLHSQLRLAIVSVLLSVKEADFLYLQEKTGATSGNLSVQLTKLSDAEYITLEKESAGRSSRTTCQLTEKGKAALQQYVTILREDYLGLGNYGIENNE